MLTSYEMDGKGISDNINTWFIIYVFYQASLPNIHWLKVHYVIYGFLFLFLPVSNFAVNDLGFWIVGWTKHSISKPDLDLQNVLFSFLNLSFYGLNK